MTKEFDRELAEAVWLKYKGQPLKDEEDYVSIIERYWHKAMEKEQLCCTDDETRGDSSVWHT